MAREKQTDALEDAEPGVGVVKDKKLDALADKFTELRDAKADMAEEMTAIEAKIIDRMTDMKIPVYRYADRQVSVKVGKNHIKVKTVKMDGGDE